MNFDNAKRIAEDLFRNGLEISDLEKHHATALEMVGRWRLREIEREEQNATKAKIQEMARAAGIEVHFGTKTTTKKHAPVKYRLETDGMTYTWSGRGRKPEWVKEILAGPEGEAALEKYRIDTKA